MNTTLTPELLLAGYKLGCFPMAQDRNSVEVDWYAPDPRAIIPLDSFHVSKNLIKVVKRKVFDVATNRDFVGTMLGCADRKDTWISDQIVDAYTGLHHMGLAHSIECWQNEELVGGLYGVAIGGAFFGESMFNRVTDASKVALVHLVHRLKSKGYTLLDTQFTTSHLRRFGAIEIPREEYERELKKAILVNVEAWGLPVLEIPF